MLHAGIQTRSGWSVVLNYSAEESAAERLAMRVEEVGVRAATVRGRFTRCMLDRALGQMRAARFGRVVIITGGVGSAALRGRGG